MIYGCLNRALEQRSDFMLGTKFVTNDLVHNHGSSLRVILFKPVLATDASQVHTYAKNRTFLL